MKNTLLYCLGVLAISGCGKDIDFFQSPKPHEESVSSSPSSSKPLVGDVVAQSANALLLYNELSPESGQVAQYYAQKRGVASQGLCGVKVHNSLAGTPEDLLSVRRQVINNCLCPHYAPGTLCNETNVAGLLSNAQVPTHLVIFKGIPTQLRNHPWNTLASTVFDKHHSVSFDYYLAHAILNERASCSEADCLFGAGSTGVTGIPWVNAYTPIYRQSTVYNSGQAIHFQKTFAGKVDPLNLGTHRTFAYGRVEGISVESTKQLIDRTLLAEQNGPRGNIYGTGDPDTRSAIQEAYNFPQQWTTGTGIPATQNAILFDGEDTMPYVSYVNVQHAFINEFNRLLSWRVGEASCTPLCKDTSNVAACRLESLDPYKELNSSCVGVNPGFVGRQVRSFPVQFMGTYPQGWQTALSGAHTVTPPVMDPDGYVVFGDPAYRRRNDCQDRNGASVDCDPKVEIYMQRKFWLSPYLNMGTALQNLKLSFDYKGYSAGPRRVEIVFDFLATSGSVFSSAYSVELNGEVKDFTRLEDLIAYSSATPVEIQLLTVTIQSPTNDGSPSAYSYNRQPIMGHFAIDNIQATVQNPNRDLIPLAASRFEEPYTNNLVEGDWAGQVHRLGATAWWGSMSHFYTGGYAWPDIRKTTEAILSGRTLGEALLYTGNGMSGIFYGDPLYQPLSAALYMAPQLFEVGAPLAQRSTWGDNESQTIYVTSSSSDEVKTAPLSFNAHFGSLGNSNYQIDLCVGHYAPGDCTTWEPLGNGSSGEGIVPGTAAGLMGLWRLNGYHIVRLKVEPSDAPGFGVQRFARFYLQDGTTAPDAFLKSIQFLGNYWPISFFDNPENGSFLNGIFKNWRANINMLQVVCHETSGLCDPNLLTLEITSLKGQALPAFSKSVLYNAYAGETQVYFTFNSFLPKCDSVKIKLKSGVNEVILPEVYLATGDFSGDGKVDAVDYVMLRVNFNRTGGDNLIGDIDLSHGVDSVDYTAFRSNFNCNARP